MLTKCQTLRRSAFTGFALLSLCCTPLASYAQDQTSTPSATAPDNTAQNKVHHKPIHHNKAHSEAADQQKENTSDRDLTAKIRRSVMADKSISTYGHNVKIITQNGGVTLKGPVHSDAEKQSIVSKAEEVVGKDKVTDQITVKP